MKAVLLSVSKNVKVAAGLISQFSELKEIQDLAELDKDKKIKALLLKQGDMTTFDLLNLREKYSAIHILVEMDKEDTLFHKSCITHDILAISQSMSVESIRDLIASRWFNVEEKGEFQNVVAIHATHRQAGCTQTTLSLAHILSSLNWKVAVIGLNPYNSGELRTHNTTYSFEQVYDLLESGVIKDGEALLKYMTQVERFHYLVGNRDFYKAPTFEAEPVRKLISIAKEHFDIVLLDVGSFYDGFIAVSALESADTHLLISTQETLSIREYEQWKRQFIDRFELHPKSRYLVVNKYASQSIITAKQLEDTLNVDLLAQVPFFPEAADAEYEEGILSLSDYKPYIKAVDGLAKALANDLKQSSKIEQTKSRFLNGIFKGRVKS